MNPSEKQIASGVFKLIDGIWYKRCTGPAHEEPEYLPATEKYFYVHKTGERAGHFTSRCRLCTNWSKLKSPGSLHGWVPISEALPYFLEASNRIGALELSRRAGVAPGTMSAVINQRSKFVRKVTLRKVMLELISIRRHKEYSINKQSSWRVTQRRAPDKKTCSGCGTPLSNYTDGCAQCWDRRAKRERAGQLNDRRPG